MIGFNIKAWGSNGYKRERSLWTEGSLVALKIAVSLDGKRAGAIGGKVAGVQKDVISQIEASFERLANIEFVNMCSFGISFTLFMEGDIRFKYYFDAQKSSDQIQSELLNLFATTTGGKLGDQVMWHFCTTTKEFLSLNLDGNDLLLHINIDL